MRVIIGCEYTATVQEAFRALGHEAYSIDLLPTEGNPAYHFQGDIFSVDLSYFDLGIFFPPCTYTCSSGLHWVGKIGHENRAQLRDEAIEFDRRILKLPIKRIALENPVGCISTCIRKYDQLIQPYEFGDDASKRTCLWLIELPKLIPTLKVGGRMVEWKGKLVERWSNQCDSGQNILGPCETRGLDRARTYPGIAKAMAKQWGGLRVL